MTHPLQVIVLLMIVIAAAKLAGATATRLHQPSVFGEILAGVVLGPSLLNILGWPLFAPPSVDALPLLSLVQDFAHVGVLLLMFVAGLETDLDQLRHVGRVAFWSAFGGVVLPFIGGATLAVAFGLPLYWEGIFIGTILTATSVSISAQTLMELGALRTREGATILGAAVIDDVMGIVVLSVVVALASVGGGGSAMQMGSLLLRITAFFAVTMAGSRILTPLLAWASGLGVSQAVLAASLVIMCVYAWMAEYIGAVAAITGSYLAGVLLARTPFKQEIDRGIHPLTYSMFVPMFFISIGLEANARELGPRAAFTTALIAVAIVAKMIGAGLFARLFGFSGRESMRVGVGMISRGEVGLIVAGYGLANGIIGQDVFSASVLMVLATTMVTPPLLKLVFPPSRGITAAVEETIGHTPEEAM